MPEIVEIVLGEMQKLAANNLDHLTSALEKLPWVVGCFGLLPPTLHAAYA